MANDDLNSRDLDAPQPPGNPMRRDAPSADVTPGPQPNPEPTVSPSSTPDGPATVPSPPTPEGEPGPDPTTRTQLENAETSLDQPSDASGNE